MQLSNHTTADMKKWQTATSADDKTALITAQSQAGEIFGVAVYHLKQVDRRMGAVIKTM